MCIVCIKWLAKPNGHREDPLLGQSGLKTKADTNIHKRIMTIANNHLFKNRIKLKEQYKQRAQLLKDARPHLWKSKNIKLKTQ